MQNLLHVNIFIPTLLGINTFYIILTFIEPVVINNNSIQVTEDKTQEKNESSILNIMQLIIFFMITMISTLLVLIYNITLVLIPLCIIGGVLFVIACLTNLDTFLKYLIYKPDTPKLTKNQEEAIYYLGLFFSLIGGYFGSKDLCHVLLNIIYNFPIYLQDFIIGLSFVIWYFFVLFFLFSISVLTLHKFKTIVNKLFKQKQKTKAIKKNSQKPLQFFWFSDFLKNKLINNKNNLFKITYYLVWFVVVILDTAISFLHCILYLIKLIFTMFICNITKLFGYLVRQVNLLYSETGLIIILASRFSVILSFIIVYIINKYNCILTPSGTQIFEFLSSVIIIPLIITQLTDMRQNNSFQNNVISNTIK